MPTAKEKLKQEFELGNCYDITSNPDPDFRQPFYQSIINVMEAYAEQRVKEELTKAAHNACQMLLLEEITPSIAFEVEKTILKQFNHKS